MKTTPIFWISTDGLTWQQSFPVTLKFLKSARNFFEYEAALSPPSSQALIISVSETNPSLTNP